jgi:hypothetical protein
VRLLALLLVLEGKLVRLVVAFRSVLPAPPSFRCSGSGLAIHDLAGAVGSGRFFPSILSFINHYFRNKFHKTFFLNLSHVNPSGVIYEGATQGASGCPVTTLVEMVLRRISCASKVSATGA